MLARFGYSYGECRVRVSMFLRQRGKWRLLIAASHASTPAPGVSG